MQPSNTCFWNVLESVNGSISMNPQFLITDSPQQFGNSLLHNTSLVSSDNSAVCHIIIARSTDSEAVELAIIGFNIAICHSYDEEVGGPLKGPLKDTFKKGRFYFIKTNSPKKLQTFSVLSQSSRLVSLQNKTTNGPTTSPYRFHTATERVERRRATELCPHRLASRSVTFIS